MNMIHQLLYGAFIVCAAVTYFLPVEYVENAATIMCLILGIAGFARLCIYHPNFNMDYHTWLMNSPWKGEALPGGPARLAMKDAIILAALLLISFISLPATLAIWPVLILLIAYNVGMLITLDKNAVFLPFILAPYYYLSGGNLAFFISGLLIVTAFYQYLYLKERKALFLNHKTKFSPTVELKLSPLYPNAKTEETTNLEKCLLIATAVSFSMALPTFLEEFSIYSPSTAIIILAVLFSIVKLSSTLKYGSCSGFMYRLKHLVLWDYRFDRIFFVPIIMLGSGLILSQLVRFLNAPSILAISISTLIISTIGFFCGPSAKEWALTGKLSLYQPKELERRSTQ